MPRSIILSNGHLFAGIDNRLRIRDLCIPGVGGPNHLNGRSIRFGVWIRNEFSWIDSDDWQISIRQSNWGFSAVAEARHRNALTSFDFEFDLSPESSLLTIGVTAHNLGGSSEEIRLFCTEQLCINESDIGDTALFHAPSGAMLHFKADVGFAFYGGSEQRGIASYSCGITGFGGAEGTFRDAEDGVLSMNPIAQGSVDCTYSLVTHCHTLSSSSAWFAILPIQNPLGRSGKLPLISKEICASTRQDSVSRGKAMASKFKPKFDRLPPEIAAFSISSIPMLLGHCDSSGAIIAAVDSDIMSTNRAHYRYCWMRDGANVASLFLDLGLVEPAIRFIEFCERVLDPEFPAFLQKYTSSGDVGATWHPWLDSHPNARPIQEDESALVAILVANALSANRIGAEFCESLLMPLTKFLIDFCDKKTAFPLPSYDLWEERHGIHLNTVASVISALESASYPLQRNHRALAKSALNAAKTMKKAVLKTFWSEDSCQIARSKSDDGEQDWKTDAATLFIIQFGIVEPDSRVADLLVKSIEEKLSVSSRVGGIARYEGDYYFRQCDDLPGNPWIITTLLLAQIQILRANSISELDEPIRWLRWAMNLAGESGILAEQYHPETGEQLSVSPLTWSHAEFVKTALLLQDWLASHNCKLE